MQKESVDPEDPYSTVKTFGPVRPLWIRIGAVIFAGGYLGALAAVITMAHGSQALKEGAEVVHRIMLAVMLCGMISVFGGYRKLF